MKIPLSTTYCDAAGTILTYDGKPDGQPVTLRGVLIAALTTEFPEDQNPANIIQDKVKRFDLYQQIMACDKDGELELSVENAAYFKPRVARCFGMIISGPVMKMLDGTPV
jgi:hypothetical protein